MSSADFRHIAVKGKVGRSERLFRAAVSAFCALTRASRNEILQLEELTLPLFDAQAKDARRFAAAALSEAAPISNALIRRLLEEPVDVAAPLLVRSAAVSDAELVALIGRHGLPHARAIARRPALHPAIAGLIRLLEGQQAILDQHAIRDLAPQESSMPHAFRPLPAFPTGTIQPEQPAVATDAPKSAESGAAAERMRERLRGFMVPAPSKIQPTPRTKVAQADIYGRLKLTALSGNAVFFQTALSDALEIDFQLAGSIVEAAGYSNLIAALKTLELDGEQAFLIAAAVFPSFFSHTESVRLFAERYQLLHREAAFDMVRGWKAESAARSFLRTQPQTSVLAPPANSDEWPMLANVQKLRA